MIGIKNSAVLILFLTLLVCVGCSGSSSSPTSPNPGMTHGQLVSDASIINNATGLLGAFELKIDPVTTDAELVPMRNSAIGESYIVSGMGFFTIYPCSKCFKIKSVQLTIDNNIKVIFSIQHPFNPGDPFKPPSALNRLDLDIFDLALVIEPVGIDPSAFPLISATIFNGICVAPDGYTRDLANLIDPDDAALPYYLAIDETEMSPIPSPTTFNKFGMGESYEFAAEFDLSSVSTVDFNLYLTMGYGASARRAGRLEPKYYNPEFNRKSAWKVDVTPPQGNDPPSIGNTWLSNDTTTTFNITVDVYDWQIGAIVSSAPNFEDAAADEIFSPSSPSNVSLEIPGMSGFIHLVDTPIDPGATGRPGDPWVYTIPIANENGLAAGEYPGLVKVTDERSPATETTSRDFLIDSPNGQALYNYLIPEYATYQVFTATVLTGCGPITGSITSPTCPITNLANNATINFNVSASSGNGGDPIVLYEADWDYNGVTFNADANNTTGVFANGGPFIVPDPCPSNIPYDYLVAFRATDSCTPPNKTVFATCNLTITSCIPPVGNVWITVNRYEVPPVPAPKGEAFEPTKPWTLHWDALIGAAEYAIYYDNDPGDYSQPAWTSAQLIDNLQFVGTTTDTNYDVPPAHLPANHYVIGNTYVVRARTIAGDPASELANSEPAFIMANGWETTPVVHSVILDPAIFEGWQAGWETSNYDPEPTHFYYYICTDNFAQNVLQGARSARMSGCMIGQVNYPYPGRWDTITHRTPVVPNAPVRFLDCALQQWSVGWAGPTPGGVCVGTVSDPRPFHPWTAPTDFEWALVESTAPYDGYNNTQETFLRNTFDDVHTDAPWCWYSTSFYTTDSGWRVGCDLNATANPNDPYIAFGGAFVTYSVDQPNWFADDIAIMLY